MKRIITIALLSCLCLVGAFPKYIGDINDDGNITISDVTLLVNIILGQTTEYDAAIADVNGDGSINITDVTILTNMILTGQAPQELNEADTLYIHYTDDGATYQMPSAWRDEVIVTVNGCNVNVLNTNTTDERVTSLSGTCANGSFTYTGTYKTTVVLNGLTLTNPSGGCIDIEDGKRVNLELAEGSVNTLTDGQGDQKAALYCKGHLEVSGGGSLTVQGNAKHAIRSKEYLEVKKTTGAITITGAESDGIHAGQYFKMKGGTITISGVKGDGIQAEALLEGDESDGQMMVGDGTIDITLANSDAAGLKSDSVMTITGGTITVNSTAADVKGMKSDGDIIIGGGTLQFTQSGGYLVTEEETGSGTVSDPSYSTAIKSAGNLTITGGEITVVNTADGGRGLSADSDIHIQGGTLDIKANGEGGILDITNSGGGTASSYRVYVSLPTSGGGGGPGGSGRSAWTNVYLYDSNNQFIAQLTQQASFTANGQTKTFYYYDFGTATSGTYYFKSDDYTRTGMGGSGTYTIKTSNFNLSLTGSDAFYSISNSYQTSGSTRTYSISNVTSTYANASTATVEGETYKAFCLKASGNVIIDDGSITLHHSGIISKGVKADGTVTINGGTVNDTAAGTYMIIGNDPAYSTTIKCQDFVGNGGEVTVNATGSASRGISSDGTLTINGGTYVFTLSGDGATYTGNGSTEGAGSRGLKSDGDMLLKGGTITINSSARGGKGIKVGKSSVSGTNGAKLIIGDATTHTGPTLSVSTTGSYLSKAGSGMESSYIGSTKAAKVMGPVTINGGNLTFATTQQAAEGLESKSTITVNGGTMECWTYDDAINAASTITINDGNVWAHSFGNDAIDSNDRTTGIVINGGLAIASSTNSPEEGFDCDNAAFIIRGGTVIGTGGSQGGGWGSSGGTPTSATQPYATVSSVSLTANTYVSLKNSSGTVVFSYKIPHNTSSANILVSSPQLSSGSSATVVYGSSSISNPETSLWNGSYTTGATITGGTSKSVTPTTK